MKRLFSAAIMFSFLLLPAIGASEEGRVQRYTPEELKAKMDRGENILILDVRVSSIYMESKIKILGAVRIDPDSMERRYKELPMDKEIITYCT